MAFTSECKTDDFSIAAVAVEKAGRAPSSALFRLQDGRSHGGPEGGCMRQMLVMEQGLNREREIEHILYRTLPEHLPPPS